jgi:hypothetical protein
VVRNINCLIIEGDAKSPTLHGCIAKFECFYIYYVETTREEERDATKIYD